MAGITINCQTAWFSGYLKRGNRLSGSLFDSNGSSINNGGELFGDATRLKDGGTAAHGFAALADLDDNGDGKIDSTDQAFSSLCVWRDLNQDGINQEGELLTLEQAKVQSLNLNYRDTNRIGYSFSGSLRTGSGSYVDSFFLLVSITYIESKYLPV